MIRRFIVSKLLWSTGAFESQGTLGLGPDTVMKSWPVTPASVASVLPYVKWVGNRTFQTCGARSVFRPWEPARTVVEILSVWGPGQRPLCGARGRCEGLWLGTHPPSSASSLAMASTPVMFPSEGGVVLCETISPSWPQEPA